MSLFANALASTRIGIDLSPRRRTTVVGSSLLLSLILHALLGLWFWNTMLPQYAIPSQRTKLPIPLQLKRIEIPAQTIRGTGESGTMTPALPNTFEAPPQLPLERESVERAMQSNQPKLILPALPQVSVAESVATALSASAQSTPFSPSDKSKLAAEIAKFQIGAASLGAPVQGTSNQTSDAQGIGIAAADGGKTGIGGEGGLVNSSLPSFKPPKFEELSADFRVPNPAINPKLPEPVLLRLPSDILFDFDSAQLKTEAIPLLQQVLALLRPLPIATITIEGHTDTIGSDAYNLKLSEDRAKAVEKWLKSSVGNLSFGVQSRGYGKHRPIVNPNGSIDEQNKNRRVEILIQGLAP